MEPIRVLLVDDEERFLRTTRKLLAKKGYEVLTAGNGKEAIERLSEPFPDVVLLDVKMPGMDGIETLRQIKGLQPDIEVILLTGHASVDTAVEGLRLGAYDFLLKPSPVEDLCLKIDRAWEMKRSRTRGKAREGSP